MAPAGDGHHLRVVRRAHNHRLTALLLRLGDNLVDALHVGAGGVQNVCAPGLEGLIDRPALPVGADHHLTALRHLLRPLHRAQPHRGQSVHHILVVDDEKEIADLIEIYRQLHRPADPVAETGRLGQMQFSHAVSPS